MIKKYFDRLVHNNEEFNDYLNATLDQDKIVITRRVAYLSAFVVSIFGIVDILSATSNLGLFLMIRSFMAINFLVIAYLSKKHTTFFLNQYHLLIPIAALFSGFGILAMILLSEVGGIAHSTYFAGLMLVMLAMFSWFYLNTTITITLGLTFVTGYILVFLLKAKAPQFTYTLLLNNLVFLLASISFGLISDIFRKHYLFKTFITQKRLIEFLIPKHDKEAAFFGKEFFLNKLQFQQSINDCIFDAKTANLKLILSTTSIDNVGNNKVKEDDLLNDVLNALYKQSNHQIKSYKEGNTLWSLSFTKESLMSFEETLESNIRKHLKTYKNKIEIRTSVLELSKDNDFEEQKNQTIKELTIVELKTISPNISLVTQ